MPGGPSYVPGRIEQPGQREQHEFVAGRHGVFGDTALDGDLGRLGQIGQVGGLEFPEYGGRVDVRGELLEIASQPLCVVIFHASEPSARVSLSAKRDLEVERPVRGQCRLEFGLIAFVFERDYDSSELNVQIGDIVEGDLTASEWIWARNARGETGWVPLKYLELLEKE